MYDILDNKQANGKKDWTFEAKYGIVSVLCFPCNRLLCTGHIAEGSITIKCGKCGRYITIGATGATLATRAQLKLVR